MATRLTPASAQAHSYQRGIPEEELELDQAESQLLLKAKDNPGRKERIRRCFGEIRQEMAQLRSLNTSSSEIRGLMRERIQQFEVAELLIAENSAAYTTKKYENLAGYQKTAAGIEAARPNFTPFAKKKPADTSLQAASQRFLQDRQMENVVRARVTAATLNAVGTVVKETAATVLGCRGEEGEKNCKAVAGYAKTLAKETAAVALGCRGEGRDNCQAVLGYIKAGEEKAKPTLEKMTSGHAITQRLGELGIEPKKSDQWFHVSAEQYIEDSNTIARKAAIAGGATGALKLLKTAFPSVTPPGTRPGKPAGGTRPQISPQQECQIESATETTSLTKGGRTLTIQKEHPTFYLRPPSKQTPTPSLTSGKGRSSTAQKSHPTLCLPPPSKQPSTLSLTSGKAHSTTPHKAHSIIYLPPPPKPPSTPSPTSAIARSTATYKAQPTISPPPPPNPPSTSFGEDTSDLIAPVRLATQVLPHENPIPRYIDVDRVLSSQLIREYSGSDQISPIQKFVQNTIPQPFKITTMETGGSGNTLHIVHDAQGNPLVVVKEFIQTQMPNSGFIPEFVANTILRAENFTDLSILPILDLGMYTTPHGDDMGLVMYPWSNGETLGTLFREHLPIHAKRAGRGLGEMGAVESPLPVCEQFLKERTLDMSAIAPGVLFRLNNVLGMPTSLTMKRVEMITNDMLRSPGGAGLVHGDAHPSNIMIDEAQVTLIDSGTLMASVNRAGIPIGMPVFDQQRVVVAMHHLGAHFGYAQGIVAQHVAEFLTGYREMMPFISAPAERYAHLFHEIMDLNYLVRGHYDKQLLVKLLETAVERVNAVFGQTRFKSSPRKTPPGPHPKAKDLLPAERINRLYGAPLYFPPAPELKISPLERLHEIWSRNQETLLGIIAKKKIPGCGLHGTSWLGMKTLMNRQTGGSIEVGDNNLFVAGNPHTVDPLDQLAAFYAMVEEATRPNFLEKNGGLFIIDTSAAVTAEDGSISRIANILPQDTRPQRRILKRMQESSHAEELLVSVTPDNYSKVIKGVIREEDTLYPAEMIESLLSDATTSSLRILAGRLRTQEILLTVFERLNVIKIGPSFPWESCRARGKEIMSAFPNNK